MNDRKWLVRFADSTTLVHYGMVTVSGGAILLWDDDGGLLLGAYAPQQWSNVERVV